MKKGFTLIELVVAIAIVSILSSVVAFGVTQYINKGKDANLQGNLSVLIPAGEVYYNVNGGDGYDGFCEQGSVKNAILQSPKNLEGSCYDAQNPSGICCFESDTGDSWAACGKYFGNTEKAFCVDSRGIEKDITADDCDGSIEICPN